MQPKALRRGSNLKYVHFMHPTKNVPTYGILEGENVAICKGEIFRDPIKKDEVVPLSEIREYLPVVFPPNILALGLNYYSHADEWQGPTPKEPILFLKANTSIIGHRGTIMLPNMAPDEVDYEGELAVIIGRKAKNVPEREASNYVLGYACGNDLTARDCQLRRDEQWARAKSFDTFCPLGPWIETELDPSDVKISTRVNGRVLQDSSTKNMIFSVESLVSFLSRCMTLLPGTVIMSGTPGGVGFKRNPPIFLKPGDTVEIKIDGVGILQNSVAVEQ
jgi:2-keto-4-pentenoate hydratase/2-oxohepta-3-ene-1,7-dioic acid hydratase in catechol pathway